MLFGKLKPRGWVFIAAMMTLFIILLFATSVSSSRIRASFRDSCNRTHRCDSRQSLTCRNGICECMITNTMTFDTEKTTCVVLSGERCSYTAVGVEEDQSDDNPGRTWREELTCVSNAKCAAGFCICEATHFETVNGTCDAKRLYERDCNSDFECRGDLKLTCQNGKCQCNATEFMYDDSKGKCVVRAGKKCSSDFRECVTNGACDNRNICRCASNFYSTKKETCALKKTYNSECSTDDECRGDLHFTCQSGICGCNSSYAMYDVAKGKCTTKAGASCYLLQECPLNSRCTVLPGHQYYYKYGQQTWASAGSVCVCSDNFYVSSDGTCQPLRDYGAICESNEACRKYRSLSCVDGTCQCNTSESIYNSTLDKCVILSGSFCVDSYKQAQLGSKPCVENAQCVHQRQIYDPDSNGHFYLHKCQCVSNYFARSDGMCQSKKRYGEECDSDSDCFDDGIFKTSYSCQSGLCSCKGNNALYHEAWKVCMKRVNVTCQYSSECGPSNNAYCERYRCTCHRYYTETTDGVCLVGNDGKTCSYTGDQICNHEKGLHCREKQCRCTFKDHQYFSENLQRCISYVGGPCGNDSLACTNNSECVSTEEGNQECQCKEGFVPVNRKCEIAFGQPCNDEPACDTFAKLSCTEGNCQCAGYQYFDHEKRICRGLVGAICYNDDWYVGFCTKGATCKALRGTRESGTCKCQEGFSTTNDRKCVRMEPAKENIGSTEVALNKIEAVESETS